MKKYLLNTILAATALSAGAVGGQKEFLDRGVVAVKTDDGVFVSWRSLTADGDVAFDVYRDSEKINSRPVTDVTSFTDKDGRAGATYEVRAIGQNGPASNGSCVAWDAPYKKIHLNRPPGGSVGPDGDTPQEYTYSPNDMSVGDVDGDGEYELFVKWEPSNAHDSSHMGFTGPTIIDCYRLDGTQLWRINLGHNIRSGAHYTQFMVYDFDGDGSAELICKTAPGTKDGKGNWVLMDGDRPTDDYRMHVENPRKILGHVRGGAEYLTCFSGKTGEALSTIAYRPGYNHVPDSIWGDDYCNRADRYLAGVAYLDGEHPSAIMCRGYYRCAFVWAVDFRDGKLQEVWLHESKERDKGLWGEGAHSLTVGDVDMDGKDEIIYGGGALDHDGTLLYRTNPGDHEGHGDALHLAKMLPDRDGLQVFMPHESEKPSYPFDTEMRDARTGEIIFMRPQTGRDIGRGLAANVSSYYPGYEYWSSADGGVYSYGRSVATARMPVNFRIYWDGDLLDELLDGTRITKPAPDFSDNRVLANFKEYSNASSCNWTKATPNISADIFGDWREEVILHDGQTKSDLLIFTTTIPTEYKVPCLMEDRQYRVAVARQNSAYNQPPHLSYSPEDTYETRPLILVREGSANQLVKLGNPMPDVVLGLKRAAGIKTSDLPSWMKYEFDPVTLTARLSGTPDAEGDLVITLTTTGANNDRDTEIKVKVRVRKNITPERRNRPRHKGRPGERRPRMERR